MKAKIIYAVNKGVYATYRVVALFDSKEKAQAFMRHFPDSSYDGYNDIVEYELNPAQSVIRRDLHIFHVEMQKNGESESVEECKDEWQEAPPRVFLHWNTGIESLDAWFFAKDRKHALKIANEYRTQLIATNRWKVANPKPEEKQ